MTDKEKWVHFLKDMNISYKDCNTYIQVEAYPTNLNDNKNIYLDIVFSFDENINKFIGIYCRKM